MSPQDWHQRADGFVEFLLNEQSLIVDPINLVGPEAKSEGCFPVSPGVQIFQNMAETAFASALDSALTVALIGSDRQGLSQGLQALEASGFDGEMVLISEHPVGQISLPMNARAIHGQVLNIGRLMSHTADIEIKPPSGQNRSVLADVVIVAQ